MDDARGPKSCSREKVAPEPSSVCASVQGAQKLKRWDMRTLIGFGQGRAPVLGPVQGSVNTSLGEYEDRSRMV